MKRWNAIVWTCVALSVAGATAPAGAVERQAVVLHPIFASNSFWYTPIPKNAPLHPNSAGFLGEFLQELKKYRGHVTINTTSWSSPIYTVGGDVAVTSVAPWDCLKTGRLDPGLADQWQAVPIPSYAEPADGSDSEMTIYQPSTDSLWEFWKAQKVDGRWQGCWGGRMQHVSKSDGIWHPHYGAAATGLPFIGGQLLVDEMRRGKIDHVIGIALVAAENGKVVSWPANRSDGENPQNIPNRVPEGLRFRLDPDVNVDALDMHPIGKAVARAAQTYGFVVWDTAGGISLRAENPKGFTAGGEPDPYRVLWKDTRSYAILSGMPWDKLQFLPMNYGRP